MLEHRQLAAREEVRRDAPVRAVEDEREDAAAPVARRDAGREALGPGSDRARGRGPDLYLGRAVRDGPDGAGGEGVAARAAKDPAPEGASPSSLKARVETALSHHKAGRLAEALAGLGGPGALAQEAPGALEVAHALVPDVGQEVRLVDQLEHEGGVLLAELAQQEALALDADRLARQGAFPPRPWAQRRKPASVSVQPFSQPA